MGELDAHFQDKLTDLHAVGLTEAEAERQAITSFGGARQVARLMYEAYSRGSWVEALIGCQPHLLAATLFATHLWRQPAALAAAFAAMAAMALLGWRCGSPTWTYSWAGYALFPPLVLSYLLHAVPLEAIGSLMGGGQVLPAIARLLGSSTIHVLVLWLLVGTAVRVSRRDWIFVSLILLPLSVLAIWTYTVERTGDVLVGAPEAQQAAWDRSMAWMCTALGLAAAAFIRMRARLLKGVLVVVVGIVAGTVVVRSLHGDVGFGGTVLVSLVLFGVLMSPLVLTAVTNRVQDSHEQAEEAHAS